MLSDVRTVFTVLQETAHVQRSAIALHQPSGSKGAPAFETYTWIEWEQISREIACGLHALGLVKGGVACTLSETRAEFYLADLGIMGAGGISAALYTSYPMAEQVKTMAAIAPEFLFVENPKTLSALAASLQDNMPRNVILLTGDADGAMPLARLRELGRELESHDPGVFTRIFEAVMPEDPAILYLTSGATGAPKMSLTSHAAILANIDQAPKVLPIGPDDSTIVFLPSAHIAQRVVLELVPLRMGAPVWFSESLSKLPAELRKIKPTFFLAPPRVWERMYATICNEVRKRPAIARKVFYAALGLGMEASRRRQAGKALPLWLSRTLKLADRVVFSKVRDRLGGRLRIAASGAAPLGKDLCEFFAAIGMPLIEGYGLTETGVLCLNPLEKPKPGSIGRPLPNVQAKLAGDGELIVKSPTTFIGYYNDEEATKSVLSDDAWFSTGDVAEVDDDGYYYITGRKKELIVSSNGKKIYPARIENLFKMEPIVNQVLLIGDQQPYVTALITVNAANAALLNGPSEHNGDHASLLHSPTVADAVQAAVAHVNEQIADFERIRRFKIVPRDFSIEQGELTPTMKIRRAQVIENHRDLVSELYLGKL